MGKTKKSQSESLVQQRQNELMNCADLLQYQLEDCGVPEEDKGNGELM